jgi:hypothetical protein
MKTFDTNTTHDAANPDPRPGPYFVSAIDGSKAYIMAGPYETHGEALAKVDPARGSAGIHVISRQNELKLLSALDKSDTSLP